jgi:hypothetical protein
MDPKYVILLLLCTDSLCLVTALITARESVVITSADTNDTKK